VLLGARGLERVHISARDTAAPVQLERRPETQIGNQLIKKLFRKIQGTSDKYEDNKNKIQCIILMLFDKIHVNIKAFNSAGYQQVLIILAD
jgi:hypothetical protein